MGTSIEKAANSSCQIRPVSMEGDLEAFKSWGSPVVGVRYIRAGVCKRGAAGSHAC